MANTKAQSMYPLMAEDIDLENDSDSTAYSITSLEKKGSGSRRHKTSSHHSSAPQRTARSQALLTWIRWGSVVVLQIVIIVLLLLRTEKATSGPSEEVETGGDINRLYPTLAHTYTHLKSEADIYMPNMTSNDDRAEVRKKWDQLMPLGSGSVSIPDYRDYPLLGEPIADDPLRSGPLFEASWTHALHCLYYSVDSYHQLIVKGKTGDENPHHAAHCFEYLRNSILCNLDMTLEGSYSTAREGGGQAHVCRDRAQAVAWIEERRVDDLQDIIGP